MVKKSTKPGLKKGTAPVGKKKGYSTVLKSSAVRNKPPRVAPAAKPRSSSTPSGVGIGFNAMVRGGVGNALLNAMGKKSRKR